MAYDDELVERIRHLTVDEPPLDEKRMFGGLGFMLDGNMAFAASSSGGLMVRIDRADSDRLCALPGAGPMEMKGRTMNGWLHVEPQGLTDDDALADWIATGLDFARTLPPK